VFEWASSVPVPALFEHGSAVRRLNDTLAFYPFVYRPLVFCIGMVLLFSKERGRHRGRMDWTRRWGVLFSYVVLLLSAAQVLVIIALVSTGIAMLFLSMPAKYQPVGTGWLIELSSAYLHYGPCPSTSSNLALVVFSSVAILLACAPLLSALASSGPRWLAAILLAPLALFALMHLVQVGQYCLGSSIAGSADVFAYGVYFYPASLGGRERFFADISLWGSTSIGFGVEAAKWGIVFAIALWLTIAQLATWRKRITTSGAQPGAGPSDRRSPAG
jgi:hypothetical protein